MRDGTWGPSAPEGGWLVLVGGGSEGQRYAARALAGAAGTKEDEGSDDTVIGATLGVSPLAPDTLAGDEGGGSQGSGVGVGIGARTAGCEARIASAERITARGCVATTSSSSPSIASRDGDRCVPGGPSA